MSPKKKPSARPRPVRPAARPSAEQIRRRAAQRPEDSSRRAGSVLRVLLKLLPRDWRDTAYDYLVLTRMDRPVGALLLLWACWWALWLAADTVLPPWQTLIIFTLGVFVMRSAGCAINDFADRKLDAQVQRTRYRPIASGRISPRAAVTLFALLLVVAFGLVLLTNRLTIELSFGGAALAALYPFTKRYTHLPQVVLGAAFGWSIPMAFAAVSDHVPVLAWVLFLANVIWSTMYDTEYAMVDRADDLKVGAKSTAILFGDMDRTIIGVLMGTFVLAMALVGRRAHLGWPYWLGLLAAIALFAWQQWIIRTRERGPCLEAFRNNNWVGFVIWAGLLAALSIR